MARAQAGIQQHSFHFGRDPLGADGRHFGRHFLHRGERVAFQLKIENGGEANRAQHPQLIFPKSFARNQSPAALGLASPACRRRNR